MIRALLGADAEHPGHVVLCNFKHDLSYDRCTRPGSAQNQSLRVASMRYEVKQPQVNRRSTTPTTTPSRRRTSAAAGASRRSLPRESGASGRDASLWNATATFYASRATESATAAVSPENATATASSVQEQEQLRRPAARRQKVGARSRRAMASRAWAPPTT